MRSCISRPDAAEKVRRGIIRQLETRHVMRPGELSVRLGLPEEMVLAELDAMVESGEVERLRPVYHDGREFDFYAITRPLETVIPV